VTWRKQQQTRKPLEMVWAGLSRSQGQRSKSPTQPHLKGLISVYMCRV